ncbi:Pyruvate/Phosphoenolpyruvate kinase-like domain-containing protein, partial [Mycena vulgaris]
QSSNLQAHFKSGKIVIETCLSYPSRHVVKTVAVMGADWCWIVRIFLTRCRSQKLLVECIQIVIHENGGKMIPVIRGPTKTSFDYMAWCLDAGAGGIIVPHLETVEEMKAVIVCRFPPLGHRSFPPSSYIPGVTDTTPEGETIFALANKHAAVIPQIESRLGIQNLDAVMNMVEIAAFKIGIGDLRLDMGPTLRFDGDESEFVTAMQEATRVSKERNIPLLGGAFDPQMVKDRVNEGFRVLVCCFDLYVFAIGM